MTVASPTGHPATDRWYVAPEVRRFGVHPYDLRRVFARHGQNIDLAKVMLLDAAERCGPWGDISKDRLLRDAVLKELTMWLIEAAWGYEGWDAMAATDALTEIRLALRARFPGEEAAGGMAG